MAAPSAVGLELQFTAVGLTGCAHKESGLTLLRLYQRGALVSPYVLAFAGNEGTIRKIVRHRQAGHSFVGANLPSSYRGFRSSARFCLIRNKSAATFHVKPYLSWRADVGTDVFHVKPELQRLVRGGSETGTAEARARGLLAVDVIAAGAALGRGVRNAAPSLSF